MKKYELQGKMVHFIRISPCETGDNSVDSVDLQLKKDLSSAVESNINYMSMFCSQFGKYINQVNIKYADISFAENM